MELTNIYQKGEQLLRGKEFGWLLDAVETGFILEHDRRILDRYTFRPQYLDGVEPKTDCRVLGTQLATPVIMSAMTMPIPAITENGLMDVAEALKEAGSLMWTGTPIPKNLKKLTAVGAPVVANAKPLRNRDQMFQCLEDIQQAGVTWVGIETDAGQGTKIHDKQVATDCAPLSLKELKDIRKKVSCPLICKGVLSRQDAEKCAEAGADGIVVSNHGAHTLDYLPHALQVLEEIIEAIEDKMIVIADGGFRRGSDVVKGLAFGASLVGLGRPILYGLAAEGRAGVRQIINQITEEMKRIMSLIGAEEPGKLSRDMLVEDP
ncbi:MAG: alpha-hydroxy acid oxidase [Desulfobacterales bacterium]|jgi:isopentenyl diphosphate isomerase/L-lactate dehydrogenase-like FMN-dependent dehydrogenase